MKKKSVLFMLLLIVFLTQLFAQDEYVPAVLFVCTSDQPSTEGEVFMFEHFESLGFDVVAQKSENTVAEDAFGFDLVFVHEAISSGTVADKFKGVGVPVLSTEMYIADDMDLVDKNLEQAFGQTGDDQTDVTIVAAEHYCAAGLTNTVAVYDTLARFGFLRPGGEGIAVAILPDSANGLATISAWESNVENAVGEETAERRVFFFTFWGRSVLMTQDGWKLFDAAVDWLLYKDAETAVLENPFSAPVAFHLQQNYPNPFNPKTSIEFSIPEMTMVNLSVYNLNGQRVQTLMNEMQPAGSHHVEFDAAHLASGVYLYKLTTPHQTITRKMLLSK